MEKRNKRGRKVGRLTGRKYSKSEANKGRKPSPEVIAARVSSRISFITIEVEGWAILAAEGKSIREIEEITGRTRRVISRELKARAESNVNIPGVG